jgi:hypothetical protein
MDDDEPATCPLCGDERENTKSVEQHISACTDPAHKGEHGPDHRDAIEGGGAVVATPPEGGGSPPPNGGPHSEDRDGGDPEGEEIPMPFAEGWEDEVTPDEDADDEGGGDVEADEDGGGGGVMGLVTLVVVMGLLSALVPASPSNTGPRHPYR